MPKYRTLLRGDVFPASFVAALQEFVSAQAANLVITRASATSVSAPAGAADAMVPLGINGLWRYNTATVTANHPGGAAGSYDVLAVASANSFSNTPQPDTDNTDYSWGLQIVASGGAGSGTWNGNAVAQYRKIGTVQWDGAQITGINQTALPSTVPLAAINSPVLATGVAGQLDAGRQLTLNDFTATGITPLGLWNLGGLTDISGAGRALTNKGAVAFGTGVTGAATEAAVFTGSTTQALWSSDAAFQIRTGSWGCWFKTTSTFTQNILAKWRVSTANRGYYLAVNSTTSGQLLEAGISLDGTAVTTATGLTQIRADDTWHFAVATYDGGALRLYLDGQLEILTLASGLIFQSASPLNIGGADGDGTNPSVAPLYGRVDEAFVCQDVLTEDQIRWLYAAKVPHGAGSPPRSVSLHVQRRRKGPPLVTADFPAAPRRLYNFTAGDLTNAGLDANGAAGTTATLANNGGATQTAGVDGSPNGAFYFNPASSQYLSATDTGLPSGTAARSMGCWFRNDGAAGGAYLLMAYGANVAGQYWEFYLNTSSTLAAYLDDGSTTINSGWMVIDNGWHFIVATATPTPADGIKQKLYIDGRNIAGGITVQNSTVLAGANGFRIGRDVGVLTGYAQGAIDSAFVCDYALTAEQVAALYAKGSETLVISPLSEADHVEGIDATNIYLTCDSLESQHLLDIRVMP